MPLSEVILIIMGLLALAMIAAGLCRNLPIPYTVFLVLLGMLLTWLTHRIPAMEPLQDFRLTPDLVFFVFLPALIFESALNMDARQLIKDIAPIIALAVIALLFSTAIIGVGVWQILQIELTMALLFGALIAATDPVAVVSLFKELGAPVRLTTLVEGESLLNDATAIVVFHILLTISLEGGFQMSSLGGAATDFLRVFFGGIAVGAFIGFGISELMRRIHSSHMAILVMSLVMAYVSFVTAEHILHVSGVMAAVSAAVAMGAYGVTRIPPSAMHLTHETWEVIALICNSLLFLMIGLSVDITKLGALFIGIVFAYGLVLVARALSVYTLVPTAVRLFSIPAVNQGERHIMWWGGLKGGLAIAIVLSIPDTLADKQMLVELTLGVVLATLLVNAPTIRPMIKFFGIDELTEEEKAELRRGLMAGEAEARTILETLRDAELISEDSYDTLRADITETFATEPAAEDAQQGYRQAYLEALRIESEELDNLFEIGLIQEYTYLDMRATLRRDRESWAETEDQPSDSEVPKLNPFQRLEGIMLRRLREANWATRLLSHYQALRISQRLQRDVAGIVTSGVVLKALKDHPGLEPESREAVAEIYQKRLARRQLRVEQIRREFPSFFATFERRLFQTAALANAQRKIEKEHHSGHLGAKASVLIERRIHDALADRPTLLPAASELTPSDMIKRVPMFTELSPIALEELAERAQQVTFLPGDIVIGQDERGNALYIIMQGTVSVHRHEPEQEDQMVAELVVGDFFGEAALLGDDVRTATVKAESPLTLLRLTRRDVLDLSQENTEFEKHLRNVNEQRKDSTMQ